MSFAQFRLDFNIFNVDFSKIVLSYKTDSTLFQETKKHLRRAVYKTFTVFDPAGQDAVTFLIALRLITTVAWVELKTGMG